MKVTKQMPDKSYPYLGVYVGPGDQNLVSIEEDIANNDIVIISLVSDTHNDLKPYVQRLTGGKEAFFTNNEKEYQRLPTGFNINITQTP